MEVHCSDLQEERWQEAQFTDRSRHCSLALPWCSHQGQPPLGPLAPSQWLSTQCELEPGYSYPKQEPYSLCSRTPHQYSWDFLRTTLQPEGSSNFFSPFFIFHRFVQYISYIYNLIFTSSFCRVQINLGYFSIFTIIYKIVMKIFMHIFWISDRILKWDSSGDVMNISGRLAHAVKWVPNCYNLL